MVYAIYLVFTYSFFFLITGLNELCDLDENETLDCEAGEWPKVFKGSSCEDISNGDFFPTYRELENPCDEAVSSFIIITVIR